MLESLTLQMEYIKNVVNRNTEDFTHAQSLQRPQPGGNCLNWVVGHIVATRDRTLGLVGGEPLWDDDVRAPYATGSGPLEEDRALPLERLLTDFAESHRRVVAGLASLTGEQLAAAAPFSPTGNPQETIGSLLAGLLFHDAYHAGQTGLLRRLAGKPGTIG